MTIGRAHIITDEDVKRGLAALVLRLTGNEAELNNVISINKLAPPYLSLNMADTLGPVVYDSTLNYGLPSGTSKIYVAYAPQSIDKVYLSYSGANGLVDEAINIKSYDGTTIELASSCQYDFPKGSRIQLFTSNFVGNKQVLLPGDTLYIPVQVANNLNIGSNQELVDSFGSDIDASLTFTNGDLKTVSGLDTLVQRIRIVVETTVGSLPIHPEFGSRLVWALGTPIKSVKWGSMVAEAVGELPEVSDVTDIQIQMQDDIVYISAKVIANVTQDVIELRNEAFTVVA